MTEALFPGKAGERPQPSVATFREGRPCPTTGGKCYTPTACSALKGCRLDIAKNAEAAWRICPHNSTKCGKHSCNGVGSPCLLIEEAKPKPKPWRKCPEEDGDPCYRAECQTWTKGENGISTMVCAKQAPKPRIAVPARTRYVCHLDNQPCNSDEYERCGDCRAPLHEPEPQRNLRQMDAANVYCPVLKAPCGLADCVKRDMCKLDFSAASTPMPGGQSIMCADGKPCTTQYCVTRNRCAQIVSNSTTSTQTGVPVTTTKAKDCHFGVYKMGTVGHATIWAGKETAITTTCPGTQQRYALIISLIAGSSREPYWFKESGAVSGNEAAAKLIPGSVFRSRQVPFLHVQWPDFSVPPLDREWWESFVQALGRVRGDVAIYCQGGHGRTGTALAIIGALADWIRKDQCPVTWVRHNYCTHCVESEEQNEYIEVITGLRVHARGSKEASYGGHGSSRSITFQSKGDTSGTSGKAPGGKAPGQKKPPRQVEKLSKNAFKKWAKKQGHRGITIPSLGELDDMELVTVEGHVYQWNKPDQRFEYKGVMNPTPDSDLEPEKPDPTG